MNCHIPEHFLLVTKVSTTNILEDGTAIVAIATTGKQLLELTEGRVTDSCDMDEDADEISVFTSYDPLQKYYLVRCHKCLVAMKRQPLCVFKEFKDVVEFKIQDRLKIGRPQVVIWTRNVKEPIVTDLVGQLHEPLPRQVPALTATLTAKRQEMIERVAKVRRMMQEKRNTRFQAVYRLTPHLCPPPLETKHEPQVLAWGPPPIPSDRAASPPLQLSRPWQKAHNGKWVIGIPVYNTTNFPVRDISLRLRQSQSQGELREYDSLVVALGARGTAGAQWLSPRQRGAVVEVVTEVAGLTSAMVVGVLEEPLFKMPEAVALSGVIVYKRGDQSDGQVIQDVLNLEEVTLTVENLIRGSLAPFTLQKTPDESDLIGVIVTSSCWQLRATPRHLMPPPLSTSLELVGLVQVKDLGCWVGQGSSVGALQGLLLLESDTETSAGGHTIHVYARNVKQVALLACSLQAQWKVGASEGSEVNNGLQGCIASLRAELCKLRSSAIAGAEYSTEAWARIRDELSTLELATDLSFESLMRIK